VLDDHDGVAQVPEMPEDRKQAVDVARVKAHGRLVEDVERVDHARAQATGQLDPLGLAPRQRPGRTVERQVPEPDLREESQTAPQLDQDRLGHPGGAARRRERVHPSAALRNRPRKDRRDVVATDANREGFGLQPHPSAGRTRPVRAVPGQEDANVELVDLRLEIPEETRDAVKPGTSPLDQLAVGLRQFAKRNVPP
jgi:hypothetical protein